MANAADDRRDELRAMWLSLKDDPLLRLKEACQLLSASEQTLRKWARMGRIRTVRIAGRYRVRKSEVLRVALKGDDPNGSTLHMLSE